VLGVAGFRQLPELCDRRLRCCGLPPVSAALSSAEPTAQSLAGVFVLPGRREAQQLVALRRLGPSAGQIVSSSQRGWSTRER
jgi:hypothetical protein